MVHTTPVQHPIQLISQYYYTYIYYITLRAYLENNASNLNDTNELDDFFLVVPTQPSCMLLLVKTDDQLIMLLIKGLLMVLLSIPFVIICKSYSFKMVGPLYHYILRIMMLTQMKSLVKENVMSISILPLPRPSAILLPFILEYHLATLLRFRILCPPFMFLMNWMNLIFSLLLCTSPTYVLLLLSLHVSLMI